MFERAKERWNIFSTEQKVSVVLLSVVGIVTLGLSMYHLASAVTNPFRVTTSSLYQAKQIVGLTDAQVAYAQKKTDSDGDGLSDWDETNVFHTNPYLRDSCGDGLPDNIRVITNHNVQCQDTTPPTQGIVNTSGLDANSNGIMGEGAGVAAGLQASLQGASASGTLLPASTPAAPSLPRDPAIIRQMLKGQVPDAELNSISDSDLLQLYDQAMAQENNPSTSTATSTATDASSTATASSTL